MWAFDRVFTSRRYQVVAVARAGSAARLAAVRTLLVVAGLVVGGVAHAQPALDALIDGAPACERATCIGLRLHVPIVDAAPIATAEWLGTQLAQANVHFETLGVGFEWVGVAPLPASAARVEDR